LWKTLGSSRPPNAHDAHLTLNSRLRPATHCYESSSQYEVYDFWSTQRTKLDLYGRVSMTTIQYRSFCHYRLRGHLFGVAPKQFWPVARIIHPRYSHGIQESYRLCGNNMRIPDKSCQSFVQQQQFIPNDRRNTETCRIKISCRLLRKVVWACPCQDFPRDVMPGAHCRTPESPEAPTAGMIDVARNVEIAMIVVEKLDGFSCLPPCCHQYLYLSHGADGEPEMWAKQDVSIPSSHSRPLRCCTAGIGLAR